MAETLVVIVNWNGGRLLLECLAALEAQSVRDFRVLVVDNASADGSPDRVAARFPDVEVLELGTNTGFAAANNAALERAGGARFVALLNPDARPEPDWLERLLEAARADPGCACFASRLVQAQDPARLDGAGDVYHVSGLAWRRGHGASVGRYRQSDEVFAPCAAAALYRREVVAAVGGFDADFFCYLEDVDLGFRLRLAGHRCRYVPTAVVHHVGSAFTGRRSDFSLYHGHRNLVWTFVKNMPAPLLLLYLPQHLLLNLVTVLWFALRGRAGVILRAKADTLRGLPAVLRKRARVQGMRQVGSGPLRMSMARGWPRRH